MGFLLMGLTPRTITLYPLKTPKSQFISVLQVLEREKYRDMNDTHWVEILEEREGIEIGRR
jgi:hypothetical protein